jgi:uncharacterized membrane protein
MTKIPYAFSDLFALGLFIIAWIAYDYWSTHASKTRVSLLNALDSIRGQWMKNALKRELRMIDTSLMTTLMQSATFFSSTTILIVGALIAGLRAIDDNLDVVDNLPFAIRATVATTELKMLTLIALFTYAFIKFSWSVRQFNFSSVLIGSMPPAAEATSEHDYLAERASRLNSLAGDNFTKGLRAYYFALAVLPWFIHPTLFMIATVIVVAMLYRMEFHSRTLDALTLK